MTAPRASGTLDAVLRLPAIGLLALVLALVSRVGAAAPGDDLKDPFTAAESPPLLPPERTQAELSELRDPFSARQGTRALAAPPAGSPDLRNPFIADPRTRPFADAARADGSPDLRNPFTAAPRGRSPREATPLAARPEVSPDLRNPFTAERPRRPVAGNPAADGDLKNPFVRSHAKTIARKRPATDVEATSGDLKNPFARRDPPTRGRSPAVTTPLRPLRTPTIQRPGVPIQRPRHPVRPAR